MNPKVPCKFIYDMSENISLKGSIAIYLTFFFIAKCERKEQQENKSQVGVTDIKSSSVFSSFSSSLVFYFHSR